MAKKTIAMGGAGDISAEKIAMVSIIMGLKDFNDPVAMQSISDAALARKKEIEDGS
jgi:hypothetical protein